MQKTLEQPTGKAMPLSLQDRPYNVAADERGALSHDLIDITKFLFEKLGPDTLSNKVWSLESDLVKAFDLIGDPLFKDVVIYRSDYIERLLPAAIDLFNYLWEAQIDDNPHYSRVMNNSCKKILKLSKRLKAILKYDLDSGAASYLHANPPSFRFIILQLSRLNPSLQAELSSQMTLSSKSKWQPLNSLVSTKIEAPESSTREWLEDLSSDLISEYDKTEEILSEATPLLDNAEDEYFVEQINADYYPHIFAALRNFQGGTSDFENKEAVVSEAIKQFKIVQLGLQKIIDDSVSRHMNAMKLQTEFLRTKVLGKQGFSLSSQEADELVEASVEDSRRMREELYKKHVAPILQKNKREYEDLLEKAGKEYSSKLAVEKMQFSAQRAALEKGVESLHRVNESKFAEYNESMKLLEAKHKREIAVLNDHVRTLEAKLPDTPTQKEPTHSVEWYRLQMAYAQQKLTSLRIEGDKLHHSLKASQKSDDNHGAFEAYEALQSTAEAITELKLKIEKWKQKCIDSSKPHPNTARVKNIQVEMLEWDDDEAESPFDSYDYEFLPL